MKYVASLIYHLHNLNRKTQVTSIDRTRRVRPQMRVCVIILVKQTHTDTQKGEKANNVQHSVAQSGEFLLINCCKWKSKWNGCIIHPALNVKTAQLDVHLFYRSAAVAAIMVVEILLTRSKLS